MKKGSIAVLFSLLLLNPIVTVAQSDFATVFAISGLYIDGQFETELELDIELGSRYLGVHGLLTYDNGLSSPATGSCFFTSADGIFCNLQIDQYSYTVDIGASLSGVISAKDASGYTIGSGTITFVRLD